MRVSSAWATMAIIVSEDLCVAGVDVCAAENDNRLATSEPSKRAFMANHNSLAVIMPRFSLNN